LHRNDRRRGRHKNLLRQRLEVIFRKLLASRFRSGRDAAFVMGVRGGGGLALCDGGDTAVSIAAGGLSRRPVRVV